MALPDLASSRVVLMGADSYRSMSELPGVKGNIEALGQAFTDKGLWGLPRNNCVILPLRSVESTLDGLREVAAQARGTLLIYYAGHGILNQRANSELYFALPDSDPERIYTALRFESIRQEILLPSKAHRKILIVDCCYSGKVISDVMGPVDLANRTATVGTYVLTACAASREADAPAGKKYTAFSGELIRAITNGIACGPPLLDMNTIYGHLDMVLPAMGHPAPQARDLNCIGVTPLVRNRAYMANTLAGESSNIKGDAAGAGSVERELVIEFRLASDDAARGGRFAHHMRRPVLCPHCEQSDPLCEVCRGRGVVDQVRRVDIDIPPGIVDGSRLSVHNATVHLSCYPPSRSIDGWEVPAARLLPGGSGNIEYLRNEIRRVIETSYSHAGAPAPRKLAKLVGIPRTAVRQHLSETGPIRWSTLRQIAASLHADIDHLHTLVRDGLVAEFECAGVLAGPWQAPSYQIAGYRIRIATTMEDRQEGTFVTTPVELIMDDVCHQCHGTGRVTQQTPMVVQETDAPRSGFELGVDFLETVASFVPLRPCGFCQGKGIQSIGNLSIPCGTCRGSGKTSPPTNNRPRQKMTRVTGGHTYVSRCDKCSGDGRLIGRAGRQVLIEIPAGAQVGQRLAVRPTEWGPAWVGRAACSIELVAGQPNAESPFPSLDWDSSFPGAAVKPATFQDGELSRSKITVDDRTAFTGY
jgi:hypothetical protein